MTQIFKQFIAHLLPPQTYNDGFQDYISLFCLTDATGNYFIKHEININGLNLGKYSPRHCEE
jgi:hypothetical protein